MLIRLRAVLLLIVLSVVLFSSTVSDAKSYISEEKSEALKALNWQGPGIHKLTDSKSTISLPQGYVAVFGTDAKKGLQIVGEPAAPSLEAVIINTANGDQVNFDSIRDGYVSLDDWGDIDTATMLDAIRSNTDKANKERKKNAIDEIHVRGWLQEPTLDRQSNTVYWAINGYDEKGNGFINSVALRLGRYGFERITWITQQKAFSLVGGDLDVMLRSHSYDVGARYTDFLPSDKTAAYGIAGLVATVLGVKAAKAAAAGGFALFFKQIMAFGLLVLAKAKVLVLLPFVWLASLVRKIFRSKKKELPESK